MSPTIFNQQQRLPPCSGAARPETAAETTGEEGGEAGRGAEGGRGPRGLAAAQECICDNLRSLLRLCFLSQSAFSHRPCRFRAQSRSGAGRGRLTLAVVVGRAGAVHAAVFAHALCEKKRRRKNEESLSRENVLGRKPLPYRRRGKVLALRVQALLVLRTGAADQGRQQYRSAENASHDIQLVEQKNQLFKIYSE